MRLAVSWEAPSALEEPVGEVGEEDEDARSRQEEEVETAAADPRPAGAFDRLGRFVARSGRHRPSPSPTRGI